MGDSIRCIEVIGYRVSFMLVGLTHQLHTACTFGFMFRLKNNYFDLLGPKHCGQLNHAVQEYGLQGSNKYMLMFASFLSHHCWPFLLKKNN